MSIATDQRVPATGPSRGGPLGRVVGVASMQCANWLWTFAFPLVVLGVEFGFVLATYVVGGPDHEAVGAGVSVGSAFVTTVVISNFVAVSEFFAFALGVGATRRAFLAGTALLAAGQAVCLGSLVLLLAQVERTTGGWGVGAHFFLFGFLERENLAVQWLVDTLPILLYASMGIVAGVVFRRWSRLGLSLLHAGPARRGCGPAALAGMGATGRPVPRRPPGRDGLRAVPAGDRAGAGCVRTPDHPSGNSVSGCGDRGA
jgi:hypothetical protein